MLLTTTSAISGVSAKKNAGTVVLGGNVPSSDRVTSFPSFIVQSAQSGLLGNQAVANYINVNAGSGLYLGSGINGGTLAQDNRDDAIIYYSQKADLAGVASTKLAQSVAGPFDAPHSTVSGSYTLYGSGYSISGTPISAPSVGGESYGSADDAATTAGQYVYSLGALPISGNMPTRV